MSRDYVSLDTFPKMVVNTAKLGSIYVLFLTGSDLMFYSDPDRKYGADPEPSRYLTVRGVEYRVAHVRVSRDADGNWKAYRSNYNFSRPGTFDGYATPAANKVLYAELEAVAASVAHDNPEKLKIAERYSLNNDAFRVEEDIAKLEKELAQKRAELAELDSKISAIQVGYHPGLTPKS